MFILHVHIQVKPQCTVEFINATVKNARQSLLESGVSRFDLAQQADDPTRFTLVEIYRTADDHEAHKRTAHYAAWRDAVGPMMAGERTRVIYNSIFPS